MLFAGLLLVVSLHSFQFLLDVFLSRDVPYKPCLSCSNFDKHISFVVGCPKDFFVAFFSDHETPIVLFKNTFQLLRWSVVCVYLMSKIHNHLVTTNNN